MRFYIVFLFTILTHISEAQVMLPAYQGVQYKGGIAGCGTLTIHHLAANGVAPQDKTVTYGTVTGIPGEPTKCWITSNLGASQQATAVNDATDASAGWYWQFNLKQGYMPNGTATTPTWNSGSNNATVNWSAATDPCTLELGGTWRIPTSTEWTNVNTSGGWADYNGPWNSALKLHAAGMISNGSFGLRGTNSFYWSSSFATHGFAICLIA
jgi:hypothetical protein